jgi:hypothetical protein
MEEMKAGRENGKKRGRKKLLFVADCCLDFEAEHMHSLPSVSYYQLLNSNGNYIYHLL